MIRRIYGLPLEALAAGDCPFFSAELPDAQYIEPEATDLVWSDLRGTKQFDHYAATERVKLARTNANISGFLVSDGWIIGSVGKGISGSTLLPTSKP